ncbi:hypothetical protein TPHA_0C00860 [Tetrapisispora phaffii CBS 4417]|uniref:Peroxin-7 n=1 Tax=Tetrapisispora phaffii (strain ATCC 24235 / CBS 4417 / NBRC 1672 / NRRL Y-8282 / UCD 70-5) TaxID=1071381 RepID=G8BR66_TETPH|nr:hypothetical protein TPHA_0C00860 [Tetrapisispora phaffii CBS 4417]CCE62242.1 hypothetical protein TPHA_0C00860 [Tetrapisispora phaffii CBS 4417]
MILQYNIGGNSGYSIQYSPFFDNRLAVASGSNYGLVGNGKLFILDIDERGKIKENNIFITQDCLFDLSWNELHENQVLVAQGDGSLRLFDTTLQKYPIGIFKEHKKEVLSCNWNLITKGTFVSSSWDGAVKMWSPLREQSLLTLLPKSSEQSSKINHNQIAKIPPHVNNNQSTPILQNKDCVYQAQFSPHDNNLIACCSGNSYITLFDTREQNNRFNNNSFIAHSGLETLTLDFNKYRPTVLASSGADNSIKIWDMRMIRNNNSNNTVMPTSNPICMNEIRKAHDLAVRRVVWSPHQSNLLLSTSYDMTSKVWKDFSFDGSKITGKTNSIDPGSGLIKTFHHHTEFVFGADWSLWGQPGFIATTGWDSKVYIWNCFYP